MRSRVGIVFQAFNLFPHLSVLANVTLSPVKVHGLPRAEAERRALAMLDRVGLSDKAAARPDELSGGQQQRVAIARALVNSPVLMLLDEVTSALDPELVGEVLSLLRELKDEGMTMLIATHEMGFARQVADTVCFLDGGRLLEVGPAGPAAGRSAAAANPAVPGPDHRGRPALIRPAGGGPEVEPRSEPATGPAGGRGRSGTLGR